MSLIAHPIFIKLRSVTRQFGLNRLLGGLFNRSGYEPRLNEAMRNAIKAGCCVWDVGANVGWYTLKFADWVGPGGQVVAFEPSATNVKRLNDAVQARANIKVMPVGLSNVSGRAAFLPGSDDLGATSMVVPGKDTDAPGYGSVATKCGHELIGNGQAPFPNIMKIDVEGHELEVLEGMAGMLDRPDLRDLFIEVHFAVLQAQGRPNVPVAIEGLLRARGFRLEWVDPSHLHASR